MRDDALTHLAASIADGDVIRWEEHLGTTPEEQELLQELRLIANIAKEHADPLPTGQDDARWGPLRLLERIGGGTFGTVYRAWDSRLDRQVALKLVTDRTSDDQIAIREARLLAKIRHPNVVAVHGAERINGVAGIWMEFIDGRTLQQIVAEQGPFNAREAVGIGVDLCRALAAVHAAGLLHRDVKPHNVMRERGGRIVLMDLGAARESEDDAGWDGAGTPLYQAPEIVEGKAASTQSDVYSVGVTLFYLLTGDYPTRAHNLESLRAAHRAGRRQLLLDRRPDLPAGVARVIERAIAPAADQRFATAGALQHALETSLDARPRYGPALAAGLVLSLFLAAGAAYRAWMHAPPLAAESSIAVLPVLHVGDGANPYVAAGLTDAFINDLSQLRGLRTISRTSSMYFQTHPATVPEIARRLEVDLVVESTLRTREDRITLDVRLIDPSREATMWSASREGRPDELPAIQKQISTLLSRELGFAVVDSDVPNAAAYDAYLRGRHQLNLRNSEGLRAAVDLFTQAIGAEPLYSSAHAALAHAYLLLGAFEVMPKEVTYPKAQAAARRALDIDAAEADAHAALGYILWYRGEADASHQHFRRALDIQPNNVTARSGTDLRSSARPTTWTRACASSRSHTASIRCRWRSARI